MSLAVELGLPHAWVDRSACLGLPGEMFFIDDETEKGGAAQAKARRAKAVCAGCCVTAECLQFAIDTGTDDGIFGGLSPRERLALQVVAA